MTVITTILYPKGNFDLKYYLDKHMPLVKSKWTSYGLQKWEVITLPAEPVSDYSTQCFLYWESEEQALKANKEDSAEIMADIKNYTDTHPIFFGGEVVASG